MISVTVRLGVLLELALGKARPGFIKSELVNSIWVRGCLKIHLAN
jgi:hypothetical protein